MDQQTNKQEPSGTEGGQVKAGDKVWVLCEVKQALPDGFQVKGCSGGAPFWALAEDCRPVEPAIDACAKTANDQLRQSLMDYPFGEPSNSPKIPDSSSEPLTPSPCMDGVNVDQFVEGIMEARGRADFKVGDAVRFVSPGHKRHGTEGVLKSIHKGKDREYRFLSECGQFCRYCTIDELERIEKADPINPSHYKHLPAEAIDIIEAAIAKAPSNQYAFLQGQVIKYMLRCWSKKGIEDLRKAKWYLDRLVGEFDDLLAEASGANDNPAVVKRYRTPTLADLANGPIACEYRDLDDEHWRRGYLVHILNGAIPFLCVNEQQELSGQWGQCRIEVSE
jgi:hypothetical protein